MSFFSSNCDVLTTPAPAGAAAVDTQHTQEERHSLAVLPTPHIKVKFHDLLKRKAGTAAVTSLANLNTFGWFPVSAELCCGVVLSWSALAEG